MTPSVDPSVDPPAVPTRRYAGRSADDRRHERRARLVAATVHLLGTHGLGATTMTAICAEAGLTERYFYESFAGREAALVAAFDHVCAEIAQIAVAAIAATEGEAVPRVQAALTDLVAWVDRHPAPAQLVLVESSTHPALRARRRELLGTFAELVETEVRELYGEAAWSSGTARAQGTFYVAGLAELVAARLGGEVDLSAEQLVAIGTESLHRLAGS